MKQGTLNFTPRKRVARHTSAPKKLFRSNVAEHKPHSAVQATLVSAERDRHLALLKQFDLNLDVIYYVAIC